MTTRRYCIILAAIFLLAWGLRIGLAARFVGLGAAPDPTDGLDQIDYELFAWHMSIGEGYTLEGGELSARRAPGTSLLLLPVYLLFGRSYLAARLWITFLSAATCLAGAWLTRRMFIPFAGKLETSVATRPASSGRLPGRVEGHPLAGLLAAALIALNPALAYYSIHLWSEAPFGLFLVVACGLALGAAQRNSRKLDLAAGVCWGLATLIRPQVVFCIPLAWAGGLLIASHARRRWFTHVALQTTLLVATVSPWVARNAVVMEKPCLTTLLGGYTFWGAHNEIVTSNPATIGLWTFKGIVDKDHPLVGTEPQREAAAWRYAFDFVRQHLSDMPRLTVWKVYRLLTPFENTPNRLVHWVFAVGWLLSLPLLLLGWRAAFQANRAAAAVISIPILSVLLCAVVFYGCVRFRHTVESLVMVLAALGVAHLLPRLQQAVARAFESASRESRRNAPVCEPVSNQSA